MRIIALNILFAFCVMQGMAQVPGGATSIYPFCSDADDVLGNNHGTVVGATLTADRFGNPNNAYYFNGQPGCYITLGTDSSLKRVTMGTISVWARPDGFSSVGAGYMFNPVLLTKNQPGNNCYEGYTIGLEGNAAWTGCITEPFCNQVYSRYYNVNYQQWYHLAMTWNFDTLRFYVNGSLHQSVQKGFYNSYLSSDSVMIGNSANVQNDRFFLGAIDDLIFYPKALNASQVQMLYNDTTSPCVPSTVAEIASRASFYVHPSPLQGGMLNISGLPAGNGRLRVFGTAGQLVLSSPARPVIDVSQLSSGLYILEFSNESTVLYQRFVVE